MTSKRKGKPVPKKSPVLNVKSMGNSSTVLLKESVLMLDRPFDDVYASLGMQLEVFESPMKAASWIDEGVDLRSMRVGFSDRAYEFLKVYWKNICKYACEWWGKNKDKYVGETLVAQLTVVLAPAFPPPWNVVAGILALVAVILIKAGLDTICEKVLEEPPR
jgi:hypothetical protein